MSKSSELASVLSKEGFENAYPEWKYTQGTIGTYRKLIKKVGDSIIHKFEVMPLYPDMTDKVFEVISSVVPEANIAVSESFNGKDVVTVTWIEDRRI